MFVYIPVTIPAQTYSAQFKQELSIHGEAPKSIYNILGIDASKNALKKAIKKFGETRIEKGHHFYESACYGNNNYIKFENIFGGSGYTISESPEQVTPCKKIAKIPNRICNKLGICLGSSKEQVSKLIGKIFIDDDVTLRYSVNAVHKGVLFSLNTTIIFVFKYNVLIKMSVSLTETS